MDKSFNGKLKRIILYKGGKVMPKINISKLSLKKDCSYNNTTRYSIFKSLLPTYNYYLKNNLMQYTHVSIGSSSFLIPSNIFVFKLL